MNLQPGTQIGPYEILGLLGTGGMGEVYRGRDRRLGRDVAIKVLPASVSSDPGRRRRFEQEARAAAALSHPNIVAVYDVGTEGEIPFLVSELLEGQTLREALNVGPVPFRRALDVARQVSLGLTAAHARGITHRDIKPENIFITSDGCVKILDFGIAKWVSEAADQAYVTGDAGRTATGVVVGTFGYMSPEQATGRGVDYRTDQFAFGIVVYEMLAGRRAFERANRVEELAAIVRDEPPPLAEVRPEAPLPLQWLLNRCLAKNPAERYDSTRDLHRDLDALATHMLHSELPVAPRPAPPSTALPSQQTPLIGRDADVSRAKQIVLRESARLVTFTGPGGIGKTRLMLQVAQDLKDQFDGGVFFANLSTITDPNLVPQVVAQACGVRSVATVPPLQGLATELVQTGKPALVLLDSFEHLLPAIPFVVDLLGIPAPLKILVTSREPLRLSGEQEMPVAPLPRPDAVRTTSLESLAANPAIQLFVERARAARPSFSLTAENARAIGEICNRLDGLPLAIELAAARVKTLPPSALLSRMETRLQLLTGGARDLPARQQTLRGAIAWSHDLLGDAEQRLFRRISVFIGGCTFEAAEAVTDAKQDLGVDIIDGIESLVHKSLLQLSEQADDEARLTMLETVREYGLERLADSGEDQPVRKAHAAYYLVLAEEAAKALEGPDQSIWVERLDQDRDNIRAALDWLLAAGHAEWGLRLASALLRYWELRELFTEGRRRLAALLALPGAAAHSAARAKAVFAAGVLAAGQRDYRSELPLFHEALSIYRELGDRQGMGIAMNAVAIVHKDQDEFVEARQMFEELCAMWTELGDDLMRARAVSNLAHILKEQGEIEPAMSRYEESLALFRQVGDEQGVAWSLRHQGDIARDQGNFDEAADLYQQSLTAFRALDDPWSAGSLLTDLGTLALGRQDTGEALRRFHDAAEAFREHGGHKRGLARVLEGFALASSLNGDAPRGIRLAAAAAALRNAIGTPLTPAEQRQVTSGLERAHAALSPAARAHAWGEGWTMSVEQAIEYARDGA